MASRPAACCRAAIERPGSAVMDFFDCYAADYRAARAKFLDAAASRGAAITSYRHPDQRGPNGEDLAVDVAHLGNPKAARQCIVISGTHGQEGFAGSAIQVAWLKSGDAAKLGDDLGVLLIHALNPYGFAHWTRTTEHNVDLNRNFLDHAAGYPANTYYAELHPFICVTDWNEATLTAADRAMAQFEAKHGASVLHNAVMSGQYTHPDGLVYGGTRREWSNVTFEKIVADHLQPAQKIGFIDWHTGIGDYADSFFLCFNEGELFERAASWWGDDKIKRARPHGLNRPAYTGLVFNGISQFLGGRPLCGAVVEFGTRGIKMRRALRLDLWLRSQTPDASDKYRLLRDEMKDAFCPFAMDWRDATIALGLDITRRAIEGMRAW
jgi:hypothetical protein